MKFSVTCRGVVPMPSIGTQTESEELARHPVRRSLLAFVAEATSAE